MAKVINTEFTYVNTAIPGEQIAWQCPKDRHVLEIQILSLTTAATIQVRKSGAPLTFAPRLSTTIPLTFRSWSVDDPPRVDNFVFSFSIAGSVLIMLTVVEDE